MNAEIAIAELQEIQLAGMMQIGDFDKVGGMYQQLIEWGQTKGVLPTIGFKAITIYHDNPNVTNLQKVRYSACVTINQPVEADGGIRPLTIKKGLYAVGRFEIDGAEIPKAWKSMNVWVVEQGYEFRDGDFFEIYYNDSKTHPQKKFIIDICIPLEKTKNIKIGKIDNFKLKSVNKPKTSNQTPQTYHDLINYMKELKQFFHQEYDSAFKLGRLYKGSPDYSYFSLTPPELRQQKLKFVIVLDHQELNFSICLSGQNKKVRRKYWEMFKGSDWKKYHLAESIENSLMIIDQIIVTDPDFNDSQRLTEQVERGAMEFIREFRGLLEA